MSQRRKMNKQEKDELFQRALALAKEGKYSKASYLLRPLKGDPRAEKLIHQMEGRKDKVSLLAPIIGVVGLVIVVIIAIVIITSGVTTLRDSLDDREEIAAEFSIRGLEGSRAMFVDLVYFCYSIVDEQQSSCVDWAETAFTDYNGNVRSCIIVEDDDGFQYRNREAIEYEPCFLEQGIPDARTFVVAPEVTQEASE